MNGGIFGESSKQENPQLQFSLELLKCPAGTIPEELRALALRCVVDNARFLFPEAVETLDKISPRANG